MYNFQYLTLNPFTKGPYLYVKCYLYIYNIYFEIIEFFKQYIDFIFNIKLYDL